MFDFRIVLLKVIFLAFLTRIKIVDFFIENVFLFICFLGLYDDIAIKIGRIG
jgi:hypothetical protein